jgi:hypothetical protein
MCDGRNSYCLAREGTVGICCPSGACATFDHDPFNCGSCGIVCPPGTACDGGLCNGVSECGPGHAGSFCNLDAGLSFLCCPGVGCLDSAFDATNCGACGVACGSGKSCDAGVCVGG